MSESKQDVFEDVLDELMCAAGMSEAEAAEYFDDELLDGLRARFAAAGKVAVPREVGETIDFWKEHCIPLSRPLGAVDALSITRTESNSNVIRWIAKNEKRFTEAWNHGWYAEEDVK